MGVCRVDKRSAYKFIVQFKTRELERPSEPAAKLKLAIEFYSPANQLLATREFDEAIQQRQSGADMWHFYAKDVGGRGEKLIVIKVEPDSGFVYRYSEVSVAIQEHIGPWYLD